jgi:hypothetical protein
MEIQEAIEGLPIIYQTPKIEFYMNAEQKLLISYAKAFSGEEEYRINMQACADLCGEHGLHYIIFESTNFKGTSPQNQKWVSEHLIPYFLQVGVRAITLVMAKDIFGKFSLNNMAKSSELAYTGGLPFQFTDSFDDAYEWIMEQKESIA